MNEKNNETKVFSNMVWRFGQVFGSQLVSFIVSIVLARILDPEVYGTVALVTVIITILQVFVDSGMANALVQKKNADDLDFSTWLFEKIMPAEDKMSSIGAYWGAMLACTEMIKSGTTCFLDMHMHPTSSVKAALDSGMRAVISRGLSGGEDDVEGGTCHDDDDALPHLFAVEGTLVGAFLVLTLHGAVAAEGYQAQGIKGVPLLFPQQLGAHAYGKLVDLYTEQLGKGKVTQLVDKYDQQKQHNGDHCGHYGLESAH